MPYIYKIQNIINHKLYIGKTLYTIQRRWKQHQNNSKKEYLKHIPLYAAIRKYGLENFTISIVEEVHDPKILSDRQQFWIEQYNTYFNGYNATKGGDGFLLYDHNKIWNLWEDGFSIKQISKKIGCNDYVVRSVLDNHNISTEERQKRGYVDGSSTAKQPVEQFDLNTGQVIQQFSSLSEAARSINGDSSCISKACKGKYNSHKGYGWRYKGQPLNKKDFSKRSVNQIDLKTGAILNTYTSLSQAAKAINGDASYLSKVCRGVQKSSHGYGWQYA